MVWGQVFGADQCSCRPGFSGATCEEAVGGTVPTPAPTPTPAPSTPAPALAAASGPWLGSDMPDSVECPIADFRAKLVAVDAACCVEPGSCSGPDAGGGQCSLHCAAKLLPLYATCNRTMTQLLDAADGVADGVAQIVETMRGACLSVPATSIIDEMIRMRDEDGCTIHGDGVGEQIVVTAPNGCSDTDATLCGLVASGVLTCEDDFCPDCTNAHKCDATCAFDCPPAADAGGKGKEHRRAQIHLDSGCSPLNLEEKVGPVNAACWCAMPSYSFHERTINRRLQQPTYPFDVASAVTLGEKTRAKAAATGSRQSVTSSAQWCTRRSSISVSARCGCRSIQPRSQRSRGLHTRATRFPWSPCLRASRKLPVLQGRTTPRAGHTPMWTVSARGSTRISTARSPS